MTKFNLPRSLLSSRFHLNILCEDAVYLAKTATAQHVPPDTKNGLTHPSFLSWLSSARVKKGLFDFLLFLLLSLVGADLKVCNRLIRLCAYPRAEHVWVAATHHHWILGNLPACPLQRWGGGEGKHWVSCSPLFSLTLLSPPPPFAYCMPVCMSVILHVCRPAKHRMGGTYGVQTLICR